MISINTGPPGNGKSLNEQAETIEEFVFGNRDIVTSTPVRVLPWATADGRGMVGLRHYLKMRYPKQVDVDEIPDPEMIQPNVIAWGKMLIVEDEDELGTLFLWRRDKDTGKWFKIRWDEEAEQFNKDDLARGCGACFIITDEAWKCYNSRRWKDTSKATEFYGRQHRKFGDDWHIVSHSHKDIDVQLNRMGQSWQVCTNYGLRRMSIFRQPSFFEIKTFYEAPSGPNVRCFRSAVKRLDPMLVQTYDTSAGVAVSGGRSADVTRRKKGLHWAWFLLAVCMFIAGLACSPILLKKVAHSAIAGSLKTRTPSDFTGIKPIGETRKETVSQGSGDKNSAQSVGTAAPKKPSEPPPPTVNYLSSDAVTVTTIASVGGGSYLVGLSDGSMFDSKDGQIKELTPRYVNIEGKKYMVARIQPSSVNVMHPTAPVIAQTISHPPAGRVPEKPIRLVSEGLDRGADGRLQQSPSRVIGTMQLKQTASPEREQSETVSMQN